MVRREIAVGAVIAVAAILIPVGRARAELSGTDVVMCRDVRGGSPVAPGSTVFTGSDPQVCVHVTLFDVSTSHTVRYEIARPDGSIYETLQKKTESAPFNEYYTRYRVWFCLAIADGEPAFLVGDWTVKVLVDGRLARTTIFQIISEGAGGSEKMRARLETMKARIDANPSDPSARVDLAEVHIDLDEFDEATVQLNRAVELDPGWATPRALLGYVKRRQGNLDEAERNLLQAIGLRDGYSWAHFQLGRVYKEKGDSAKAIEQFRRVVQIEGNTSLRKSAEEELAKLGAL